MTAVLVRGSVLALWYGLAWLLQSLQVSEGAVTFLGRKGLGPSPLAKPWGRDALLPDGFEEGRSFVELKSQRLSILAALGLAHDLGGSDFVNGTDPGITAVGDAVVEFLRGLGPEGGLTDDKRQRLEKLEKRTAKDLMESERDEAEQEIALEHIDEHLAEDERKLATLPPGKERMKMEISVRGLKATKVKLKESLRNVAVRKAKTLRVLREVQQRRAEDLKIQEAAKEVRVAEEAEAKKAAKAASEAAGYDPEEPVYPTTTITAPPAYKELGVKVNSADDWYSFKLALQTNACILLGCVLLFSFLRQRYWLVYQRNNWNNWGMSAPEERAEIVDGRTRYAEPVPRWRTRNAFGALPTRLEGTLFDWLRGSIFLSTHTVASSAGLDQAMLIQFANMGIIVFLGLAVPAMCILAPIHVFYGGNAAGNDRLSWQGFANVRQGATWVCWVHAFFVWYVVLFVDSRIYKYQAKFVPYRVRWLQRLSNIQACTILVENIPLEYRTPNRLRTYMNSMFGREVVKEVHLLVRTERLEEANQKREATKKAHEMYERARSLSTATETAADEERKLHERTLEEMAVARDAAQDNLTAECFRLKKAFRKIEREAVTEWSDHESESSGDEESLKSAEPIPDSPSAATLSRGLTKKMTLEKAAKLIQRLWRWNRTKKRMQEAVERSARSTPSERTPRSESGGKILQPEEAANLIRGLKSNIGLKELADQVKAHTPLEELIIATYSATAFVTFESRHDAIMARQLVPYKADRHLFKVSEAPDPSDVQYGHLKEDELHWQTYRWVGYGLIALLFALFLPTIAFISYYSMLDNWHKIWPDIVEWQKNNKRLAGLWNGMAGALGLNLVLGLVPSILTLISQACFKQTGHALSQHDLHKMYFGFLIVFQLLVVSITHSLTNSVVDFLNNPLSLVSELSQGMERTTHFFLSIFVLQWATVAMEFTRYVILFKYWFNKHIIGSTPLEAIEATEPEDQDFYGIGARSARIASIFVIGIAFVSLCPLISVLVLVTFILIRIFLAYQVVYAETRKKGDTGGQFFVTKLKQCQGGLVLYILCMVGVLLQRCQGRFPVPALVALLSLFYILDSIRVFDSKFNWETICHEKVMETHRKEEAGKAQKVYPPTRTTYVEPLLIELKVVS